MQWLENTGYSVCQVMTLFTSCKNLWFTLFCSHTEHYWESMSQLHRPTTDDQGNINLVLDYLRINWLNYKKSENIDYRKEDIHGLITVKRPKINMIVSLMSFNTVCRHTCSPEHREDYYVWHALAIKENRTVVNKVSQARVGSAWFLSEQWQQLSETEPNLKREEWLRYVTESDSNTILLGD